MIPRRSEHIYMQVAQGRSVAVFTCISALGLEMQLSSSRKDSKKKGSSKKKSASVTTQGDGDDDWNSTLEVGDVKDSNGALLSEGDSVVVTQVPNASLTDYRTLASNI